MNLINFKIKRNKIYATNIVHRLVKCLMNNLSNASFRFLFDSLEKVFTELMLFLIKLCRSDECTKNCGYSFICADESKCILKDEFCDGITDCKDRSDERVNYIIAHTYCFL